MSFFPLLAPNAILVGAAMATVGWLYTSRRSLTIARKQHTINIMLKGNFSQELRGSHKFIAQHFKAKKPIPDESDTEYNGFRENLQLILNHYEFIAAGIRRGDLDEKLVLDSERGTVLNAFENSEDYIYQARNTRRNQSLYEHLEWLHKRWVKQKPNRFQGFAETVLGVPFYGKRNEVD